LWGQVRVARKIAPGIVVAATGDRVAVLIKHIPFNQGISAVSNRHTIADVRVPIVMKEIVHDMHGSHVCVPEPPQLRFGTLNIQNIHCNQIPLIDFHVRDFDLVQSREHAVRLATVAPPWHNSNADRPAQGIRAETAFWALESKTGEFDVVTADNK